MHISRLSVGVAVAVLLSCDAIAGTLDSAMPSLSALPNARLDPVTAARRQRRVLATAT
jgi:hypothetical protein